MILLGNPFVHSDIRRRIYLSNSPSGIRFIGSSEGGGVVGVL